MNHKSVISWGKERGDFQTSVWTTRELGRLRELAPLGASVAAQILGRSVRSVRRAAERHRISLRREGERRGRILGQPRGVSIATDGEHALRKLREDALAGHVDLARVEQRGRLAMLGETACPSCGIRPIEVHSTGFCVPCHKRALALGHAHELEEIEAQRVLDRERQRKHRRKAGTEVAHA